MNIRVNRLHFPVTTLGPGRRIGIWLQGCSIGCRGCVSEDTWEPDERRAVPVTTVVDACRRLCPDGPDGITISGGEPFEQAAALADLVTQLRTWRDRLGHSDLDLLCYSGLTLSTLQARHGDVLALLDAVIPEPFLEHRPIGGRWRGSDNQPIVPLSPLGEHRYGAGAEATDVADRRLQVETSDGRLLFIGIPRRGDLERHRRELEHAGISIEPGVAVVSDSHAGEKQYYCKICNSGPVPRTTRFCKVCKQPTAGNLRPWPPPDHQAESAPPTRPHETTEPGAGAPSGTDDSLGPRGHPHATRRDRGLALRFPFGDVPVGHELRIGREPTFSPLADRLAAWDNVSREHAVITVQDGCCTIADYSSNGTWVNEVRLTYDEPVPLALGDRVRFAARLVVEVVEGPVP